MYYTVTDGFGSTRSPSLLATTHVVTGGVPSALSVLPNASSGSQQTFSFDFSEPFGFGDISSNEIEVAPAAGNANCRIRTQTGGAVAVQDSGGTWLTGALSAPGMNLTNGSCTLRGGSWTATEVGGRLTLNVEFASSYAGSKTIRAKVANINGLESAWTDLGVFAVIAQSGYFDMTSNCGASLSIPLGNPRDCTVTYTSRSGFAGAVTTSVGASGLGLSAMFYNNGASTSSDSFSLVANASATRTVRIQGANVLVSGNITINGASTGVPSKEIQHTAAIVPPPNFTLVSNCSNSLNLPLNQNVECILSVTSENGFVGDIALAKSTVSALTLPWDLQRSR